MKIKAVHSRILTRRYARVLRTAHLAWAEKHAIIVFVEGEDGTMGLGEAWCDAGDPRVVKAFIDSDLAPRAIGLDTARPEALWRSLMASKVMGQRGGALYAGASAIDIAAWDLQARVLALPLWQLLGGAASSIPVYASGGFYGDGYTPADLVRDMLPGMERGCAGLKVKAGLASPAAEEARIAALREAIGPDAWLMADFLFAPTVPQAIDCTRRIAPYGLRFLEAPTALENLPGWRAVKDASGLLLAGPEIASGIHMFRDAIAVAGVDFLQLDVITCGGMTEARRIAGLGAAYGLPITLHASGSAVAFAANAAFGAAIDGDSIEFHLLHQALFDRLWASGFAIDGGRLWLPDAPGLGIDLSPDDRIFETGETA